MATGAAVWFFQWYPAMPQEGFVVDSSGTPIPGAQVVLKMRQGTVLVPGEQVYATRTDRTGHYRFPLMHGRRMDMSAVSPGYHFRRWEGGGRRVELVPRPAEEFPVRHAQLRLVVHEGATRRIGINLASGEAATESEHADLLLTSVDLAANTVSFEVPKPGWGIQQLEDIGDHITDFLSVERIPAAGYGLKTTVDLFGGEVMAAVTRDSRPVKIYRREGSMQRKENGAWVQPITYVIGKKGRPTVATKWEGTEHHRRFTAALANATWIRTGS